MPVLNKCRYFFEPGQGISMKLLLPRSVQSSFFMATFKRSVVPKFFGIQNVFQDRTPALSELYSTCIFTHCLFAYCLASHLN